MEFYPNKGLQLTQTSNMSQATELPKIGDTMYIMAKDSTYTIVGASTLIPNGCDVIKLTVEALKKSKTVLE